MKPLLAVVLLVFLAAPAAAPVYGTFPDQLDKDTDSLETDIGIGVVNTGDQTLRLRFEFQDSNLYNVSNRTLELQPVRITEDPGEGDWKYLGNDRYAEIRSFSFPVRVSEYRSDNTVHVPMTVEASPVSDDSSGASSPVSQSSTYNYTLRLSPELRPLSREAESENQVQFEETGEEPDSEDEAENEQTIKSEQNSTVNGEEDTEVDGLTYMLVAAVALTALYLFRVIA